MERPVDDGLANFAFDKFKEIKSREVQQEIAAKIARLAASP